MYVWCPYMSIKRTFIGPSDAFTPAVRPACVACETRVVRVAQAAGNARHQGGESSRASTASPEIPPNGYRANAQGKQPRPARPCQPRRPADGRPEAGPSGWQNGFAEPPGEAPGGYRGGVPPKATNLGLCPRYMPPAGRARRRSSPTGAWTRP